MDNFSSNIELILKGGFLMIPLMLLSLYTITIIVMKILQFRSSKALKTEFADDVITMLKIAEIEKAEKKLERADSPIGKVMQTAFKLTRYSDLPKERVEPEIERIGIAEVKKLESHLRGLEIIAGVAPLVGLLGTVIGMVKAFARISEAGSRVDPSVLAGGIWEALITTVGGLVVAIPAFIAFYVFDSYVEKIRVAMKDYATQILNLEKDIKFDDTPISVREEHFLEDDKSVILAEMADNQEDVF